MKQRAQQLGYLDVLARFNRRPEYSIHMYTMQTIPHSMMNAAQPHRAHWHTGLGVANRVKARGQQLIFVGTASSDHASNTDRCVFHRPQFLHGNCRQQDSTMYTIHCRDFQHMGYQPGMSDLFQLGYTEDGGHRQSVSTYHKHYVTCVSASHRCHTAIYGLNRKQA